MVLETALFPPLCVQLFCLVRSERESCSIKMVSQSQSMLCMRKKWALTVAVSVRKPENPSRVVDPLGM